MVTLITGAAHSGKSRYAESISELKNCLYINTADLSDPHEAEKLESAKLRRPAGCTSLSAYRDFDELLFSDLFRSHKCLILDDAASMLRRTYKEVLSDADKPDEAQLSRCEERVKDELLRLIAICKNEGKDLAIVTEENVRDIAFSAELSRAYAESLGRINCVAAKAADQAFLLCCGLPLKLK